MSKMRLQILGGFALSNHKISMNEKSLHSNKLVRLLVYILMNRERNLSHEELIDTFWQEDGSRNPEGALKNLIYRLRTELREFGEGELVITSAGAYRWNPDVEVETDYEELEQMIQEASNAKTMEEKRSLLERAIPLYRKDTAHRLAMETWMVSRLTYYRLIYMDAVKELAKIYAGQQEWDLLEILTNEAIAVDNLDEDIYYWQIKSQVGKKNYDQALRYYENAKNTFYEELGIREIEQFRQIYEEILALSDSKTADISGLMDSLCEKETPGESFFCEYPVFREIYRVEARRIHRTGIAEYVLLVTLRKTGSVRSSIHDSGMEEGMKTLEKVLKKTLRSGDVVARFSNTQFVLLLAACSYESTRLVEERIRSNFHKASIRKRLSLQFEVEGLLEAENQNGQYKWTGR